MGRDGTLGTLWDGTGRSLRYGTGRDARYVMGRDVMLGMSPRPHSPPAAGAAELVCMTELDERISCWRPAADAVIARERKTSFFGLGESRGLSYLVRTSVFNASRTAEHI